jgi:hypothetical protein
MAGAALSMISGPGAWLVALARVLLVVAATVVLWTALDFAITGLSPPGDAFETSVVATVLLALAGIVRWSRARARRRYVQERTRWLEALMQELGGSPVVPGFTFWARWLDAHWAGDVAVEDIATHLVSCASASKVGQFPVLALSNHAVSVGRGPGWVCHT